MTTMTTDKETTTDEKCTGLEQAIGHLEWIKEEIAGLKELEVAGNDSLYEEKREALDPLSIQVRSGWDWPGKPMEPYEYGLTLACGGPGIELRGDLDDYNQPMKSLANPPWSG